MLDSCEHVIEAAAVLAESLANGTAGVRVLATEVARRHCVPRGASETFIAYHRFATPPPSPVAHGTGSASVFFFPSSCSSNVPPRAFDGFTLTDEQAPVVAEICRKLDGIALAIEIVAGRIDGFGVRELATHLDDQFRLLMRGRRTALLRHQTLNATLDWSYEFLSEPERKALSMSPCCV